MCLSKVLKFANEHGYNSATFLCEWKGFKCYEPNLGENGVSYIGLPLLILEDMDGNLRMSTPDEAMQQIRDMRTPPPVSKNDENEK